MLASRSMAHSLLLGSDPCSSVYAAIIREAPRPARQKPPSRPCVPKVLWGDSSFIAYGHTRLETEGYDVLGPVTARALGSCAERPEGGDGIAMPSRMGHRTRAASGSPEPPRCAIVFGPPSPPRATGTRRSGRGKPYLVSDCQPRAPRRRRRLQAERPPELGHSSSARHTLHFRGDRRVIGISCRRLQRTVLRHMHGPPQ